MTLFNKETPWTFRCFPLSLPSLVSAGTVAFQPSGDWNYWWLPLFFVHGGFDCTCALTWAGSVRFRSRPNLPLVAFVKMNPQKQFDVTEQDEALVLRVPSVWKWAAVVFCLDFKPVTSAGGQTPSPSFIDPIWKEKGTKGKTQALNPPTCPPAAPQHLRQSQTLSYMNPCRSLAPCLKRDGTWASQSSLLI